jgi:hypothetical protein
MFTKFIKNLIIGIGFATCLSAYAQNTNGFSGQFAPNNWQSGSNAPVNLVNTAHAPVSVTLQNYVPWATSGATFVYNNVPSAGTISFTANLSGSTPTCLSTYWYGKGSSVTQPTLANGASASISFKVAQGDSFGFAVNGANSTQSFGCNTYYSSVSLTISNFTFVPDTLPMGPVVSLFLAQQESSLQVE